VHQIKTLVEKIGSPRRVKRSGGLNDDLLLDLPGAGKADDLGTGGKNGPLSLDRRNGTRTTSAIGLGALFV
jgi:hypothetical protein